MIATSLKPFCSNRLMISPTRPRWTPSGLMAMKVRSALLAVTVWVGVSQVSAWAGCIKVIPVPANIRAGTARVRERANKRENMLKKQKNLVSLVELDKNLAVT